jgi:hypothetical protein
LVALKITYIIPKRHDKNHWLADSVTHLRKTTHILELGAVTELLLGSIAELCGNLRATRNVLGFGNSELLATLDEVLGDLLQLATRAVELCHHRHLLGSIDSLALSVEIGISMSVWVEITAIRITITDIALLRIGTTALSSRAGVVCVVLAWMRG